MSAERLFLKRAATRPFFYGRSSSARGQRPEPGRPCPRGTNQVATGRNAGLSGFSFCSSVQLKHCTAPPSQACGMSLAPETGNPNTDAEWVCNFDQNMKPHTRGWGHRQVTAGWNRQEDSSKLASPGRGPTSLLTPHDRLVEHSRVPAVRAVGGELFWRV